MIAIRSISLLAGFFSLILWPAHATETPVHDCDLLAADPQDDNRVVLGTDWDRLDPDRALTACEAAIREFPETPRFKYQYARTLHKMGDNYAAAKHFQDIAEQGYIEAQSYLGDFNFRGIGVPKNDAEAARWYRMAAEQGFARAQANLGDLYVDGQGVPQDDTEALKWIRMSVEQGNAQAQSNLGWMYEYGRGVPQNDAEAAKWYRMAGEQGLASAQTNLGGMYYWGRGGPKR